LRIRLVCLIFFLSLSVLFPGAASAENWLYVMKLDDYWGSGQYEIYVDADRITRTSDTVTFHELVTVTGGKERPNGFSRYSGYAVKQAMPLQLPRLYAYKVDAVSGEVFDRSGAETSFADLNAAPAMPLREIHFVLQFARDMEKYTGIGDVADVGKPVGFLGINWRVSRQEAEAIILARPGVTHGSGGNTFNGSFEGRPAEIILYYTKDGKFKEGLISISWDAANLDKAQELFAEFTAKATELFGQGRLGDDKRSSFWVTKAASEKNGIYIWFDPFKIVIVSTDQNQL
jgi:hypothetical protein